MGERLATELTPQESLSYHYLNAQELEPTNGGIERLVPLFQEILFKLDLALELLTSKEHAWKGRSGRLTDISGSGVQFLCGESLALSSLVEMRFHLPGQMGRYVQCAGRVTRSEGQADGWTIACEFTQICESDRERIIQYAFQVSSKMLRESRQIEDRAG